MKKILTILLLLTISALISCSGSSGSSTEKGYTDPGLETAKTLALKSYSLEGGTYACASDKSCGAIIFTGKLSDVNYVGFAVDNYSTVSPFKLKIYWPATSIPSSISNPAGYVVKATIGTTTYSTVTSGNLAATIATETDANGLTVYRITFTDSLTIAL